MSGTFKNKVNANLFMFFLYSKIYNECPCSQWERYNDEPYEEDLLIKALKGCFKSLATDICALSGCREQAKTNNRHCCFMATSDNGNRNPNGQIFYWKEKLRVPKIVNFQMGGRTSYNVPRRMLRRREHERTNALTTDSLLHGFKKWTKTFHCNQDKSFIEESYKIPNKVPKSVPQTL